MQCASNLKQIALGLHNFESAHPGGSSGEATRGFPAGTVAHPDLPPAQRLSWFVEILPYVEQEGLARQFDRTRGWADARNAAAVQGLVRYFRCADWEGELAPAVNFTCY